MTLRELKALVASEPIENDDLEVKVWLPGSRISLRGSLIRAGGSALLIEGNLDPGSALAQ